MTYVRKTYVEFCYQGDLFSGRWTREVKTRDVSRVKLPENAFGFWFFDIISVVVDVDGKKVRLTSGQINDSPSHYYGGKIYTVEEFRRKFPSAYASHASDIKINGHKKMLACRTGNWVPFEKNDIFIKAA